MLIVRWCQNFLVNGMNVNPTNTSLGERYKLKFTPGKKHHIRFINTAVDVSRPMLNPLNSLRDLA